MQNELIHSLRSAAIGIIIILCCFGFVKLLNNLFIGKEGGQKARLVVKGIRINRRADIALLIMLTISFGIALWLAILALDHIKIYPNSVLMIPINFFGRLGGSTPYVYTRDFNLIIGVFLFPFSILGGISFIMYYKYFKGRITQLTHLNGMPVSSPWAGEVDKCLSCGKEETVGNTRLCERCNSSSIRIMYAVLIIAPILLLVMVALAMTCFKVVR